MDDRPGTEHGDWVRRLQAGSPGRNAALAELRDYLLRGLSRSLTHRYGGRVDVEDVVQLALLKVLDSLNSFRAESRFTTWAMSIAVRIGIGQLRRSYYQGVSLETVNDEHVLRIDVSGVRDGRASEQWEKAHLLDLLQKLIDQRLTARQRLAIRGTLEGVPVEEIARRLNSNRNAVYKLVHDARMQLREGFLSSGVTMEEVLTTIS